MQEITDAHEAIPESSTVRIRADVLNPLVEQTQRIPTPVVTSHEPQRSEFDNRTRKVWHSRLGAWLRQCIFMAPQSCVDRALDRKGKAAFLATLAANERELREAREVGERMVAAASTDARESYVATAQHCNTSHAFVLQRLTRDAKRLGKVVGEKLRNGTLKHDESTLVDESSFDDRDFLNFMGFPDETTEYGG